ncbi:hypothetical protein CDL12_20859 [Handroanthus impetiginosus]|uniref:Uncharacterized protein n=1 Tax=Handroanthus impetiginosus TaxID=429701 RepID=A0A2G9GMU1_9LAMI|nr:hypothetical protein CDL12_20859 [Handroanthus impetiginosus]
MQTSKRNNSLSAIDLASAPQQSKDHPLPRRRSSISSPSGVVPIKLTLDNPSSALSSGDLELLPIKPPSHSYSSLKDLLPSITVNSLKPKLARSDICIRNRLVKQAAWAYLRPMSTALVSTDGNFFHRLWTRVASFIDFLWTNFIRAIDGSFLGIRIRSSTEHRYKMCFV